MRQLVFTFALVSLLACDDSTSPSPATPGPGTDAGGTPSTPSTCPTVTGAGTTHAASPTADETWTAAASPHVITASQSIPAGVTVTIEPCAVVKIQPGLGVLVQGKLLAIGAADKPIRIERGGAEPWTNIETRAGAELRLAHTTVEGGGDPNGGRLTQFGMIDVRGNQDLPPQPIFFADHVTLAGSGSLGVWLREGGSFAPGSTDLTISGGAGFPVLAWTNAAGTLPTGKYTGNATDEIFLAAMDTRDAIGADMTLFNRGVPYRVGGDTGGTSLRVGVTKTSAHVLTIEPGVTMRFAKGTRLLLDADANEPTGALAAEGTAAAPIVFTSAEATPAAGDWPGIHFAGRPDARNKISNATISYAGGTSGISSFGCPSPPAKDFSNTGAVIIYGDKPAGAFVTNTRIENSAGDGIVRGWTGDEIDFIASNTFTGIAHCNQTSPKPTTGTCPDTCAK